MRSLTINRKDETLVLILQTLDALNLKLDRALQPEALPPLAKRKPSNEINLRRTENTTESLEDWDCSNLALLSTTDGGLVSAISEFSQNISKRLEPFRVPPRQNTEVHKLLGWPAVQTVLSRDGADLSEWDGHNQGTENWLMDISMDFAALPVDWPTDIFYTETGDLNLEIGRSITLNKEYVESVCAVYFQSFHCIYPVLDQYYFYTELLPQVCRQSFSETYEGSALVLMVLALGSVAQEGATGSSLVDEAGSETGIRGGTVLRPPGLVFLNEARRRLGFALTAWTLNSLQCCILFASVCAFQAKQQYD
jgi:hypothetical protein